MTDKEKLEAIRAEIHRLVDVRGYDREMANDLFTFMDSLPNEPISEKFAFKSIPRLLEMIEPTDRAKSYVTKLADAFDSEGYYTDAKIVRESLKIMNGEKVPMATMDEEPVSEELEKVVEEIVDPTVLNAYGVKEIANRLRSTIIEPVSEELEEACEQLAENARKHKAETSSPFFSQTDYRQGVVDGAKLQKEHLWKSAEGSDLPIFDREVIVLTQPYPLKDSEYAVYFAHRPDPKGWDGKSIITGNVEHYTPKTYGKGGWNIPDVIFWLDVKLPKRD